MSNFPLSSFVLQCLICRRGPFCRGTLRLHQLTTHRGGTHPRAKPSARAPSADRHPDGIFSDGDLLAEVERTNAVGGVYGFNKEEAADAVLHVNDDEIAARLAVKAEVLPAVPCGRKRRHEPPQEATMEEFTYPSVATCV